MKRIIIAISLLFPFATVVRSQTTSIDFDFCEVSLGMPRQEVIKRCTDGGLKQVDSNKNSILWNTETDTSSPHYEHHSEHLTMFKNDRLVFADRKWTPANSRATVGTVMAALRFTKNNPQNCVIEYRAMHIGSVNFDRVFIECGDRTIYFDGDREGKFSEDVTESIGEIPKEEH
jgi:hypothetical protein